MRRNQRSPTCQQPEVSAFLGVGDAGVLETVDEDGIDVPFDFDNTDVGA